MLRAADGSPGGHPHRDHPPALQTAGEQTVGAFAKSTAVDLPTPLNCVTVANINTKKKMISISIDILCPG